MHQLALRALRRAPIIRPLWDQYERLLAERDALVAERDAAGRKGSAGDGPDFERFIAECRRVLDAPPETRRRIEDRGVVLLPADFNSPAPLLRELDGTFEGFAATARPLYDRIFDAAEIRQSLAAMAPFAAEFDPPQFGDEQTATAFFWGNTHFSFTDAVAYYAMLRRLRPRRIVEIGSGSSTLVADAALRKNGAGEVVCIDPYIRPAIAGLARVAQVIRQPVQALPVAAMQELVEPADMLFIDSTHTVKIGSDCVYLYLLLLPAIEKPLLVHSHDVFLPFGMPVHWARERQHYWNEQYLLYAYLLHNSRARVVFGSAYAAHYLPAQTAALMAGKAAAGGCSLWYEINRAE
jgi:hypothetical protein